MQLTPSFFWVRENDRKMQKLNYLYYQVTEMRMQRQFDLDSFPWHRNLVSPEKLENNIRQKSIFEAFVRKVFTL